MKITLKIIGLLGFILFSTLFIFTYHLPPAVEKSAKNFIIHYIADDLKQNYLHQPNTQLFIDQATQWKNKALKDQKTTQNSIDKKLPELIASTIATTCGYQCEKAKNLQTTVKNVFTSHLTTLKDQQERLTTIIKDKYLEVLDNIKHDLRIFLSTNAGVFVLLLILTLLKPQAIRVLFIPALLLTFSTLLAAAFYIFEQDWFYTILYNDYMGFGYLLYIGGLFVLLMDIAINKARISTWLLNTVNNLVGGIFHIAIC